MSQVCQRCYKVVPRACQSETEWTDCPNLRRKTMMTHKQASELMRLETKDREQGGIIESPISSLQCWAEKRVYTGSMFPAFVQCSKPPRPGCLTCHWHQDREAAAQAQKARRTAWR